jgi:uncharacterized protein (DUF1501 family)
MDIWQSAQPEIQQPSSGWIGRYFDNTCPGCDPHVGVSIGETLPLAMQGEKVLPLSFERPDSYRYNGRDKTDYIKLNQVEASPPPASAARQITAHDQLDFLHRTAMDAQLSSEEILRLTRSHTSPLAYPANEFGNGLKTIAAMIAGGLPTRVYYVSLSGFDTHVNQLNRHDALMKQLNDGLGAFWADLKQQKNSDRVLAMTFSEFGRRVQSNASNGTDHGAAAPMFVMGTAIRQGLVSPHPSMTDLDQGDLKFVVDFRSVYASVLQNWLDTPSKPILGDQFRLLPLVKDV